jgi:3-oxoacyl-[acyl-carrier-protein] synthase-3
LTRTEVEWLYAAVTALDAVSVYVPEHRFAVRDLAAGLRLSETQVKLFYRYHGLNEIRRDPDVSLLELLSRAVHQLTGLRGREHQVRYVLYGRTMPVVAPYPANPLHELCQALGLHNATAFTLTQQSCASGLLAIDVAGRLLAAEPADDPRSPPLALVLTGEKAFTYHAQLIPETSIFSEATAACLVSADGPRDRLLAYACMQRGEFDTAGGEPASQLQRVYRPALAEVIRQALAEAETTLDEVKLILPHNVNLVTWQRLCRLLRFPLDRVLLDNVPTNGHAFCADAFLNYHTARQQGRLVAGDRYLVATVGAGHGATFAAMLFEH